MNVQLPYILAFSKFDIENFRIASSQSLAMTIRYFISVFLFGFISTFSFAQNKGWDLIRGLIELSANAAKLSDNCFQLTEDRIWSGGSIYYPNKIDLNSNFNMDLEVFLGCKDGDGADGMVFIFSPKMAMGREGEGMGFSGVSPSIGIEIDTWQNGHLYDPPEDHLAVLQDGVVHHRYGLTQPITIPNIDDCENHALKINWSALEKTLTVTLDGKQLIRLQKDIIQEIFGGTSEVFWGVTSSTGQYSNQHKVCFKNIRFNPASAIATSSFKKIETALLDNQIVPLAATTFSSGKTQLSTDTQRELDELVAFLQSHPDNNLGIYGHTDSSGNPTTNERLSAKRAEAIANYLITKGIDKERLLFKGVGDQYPIASNDTPAGRAKNRRIEVYLFKPFP